MRTEEQEQIALFNWAKYVSPRPELEMLFAIPNGGYRAMQEGKRLKAAGVLKGVPDVFLAFPIGIYHGLWIEMKRNDGKARLSTEQMDMLVKLQSQGYAVAVCYGAEEAQEIIELYLDGGEIS